MMRFSLNTIPLPFKHFLMTLKTKYLRTAFLIHLISLASILSAQEAEVVVIQDSDIDKLLIYKTDIRTLKVYKIQVFQSVDPDSAETEKSEFLNIFDEWPVEIHWNTPNYKVWVGNFTTRLEADRAWAKIKTKYMNAIIFQPKLDI